MTSTPGAGSTFTLMLPWRQPDVTASQARLEAKDEAGTETGGKAGSVAGSVAGSETDGKADQGMGGATTAAPPPDAAQPAPGLARLLLAEDDPINADLLCEYLEVNGYTLVWVEDGVEAVQKAAELHPDLILMDVQMPRLDGLQAIQQIRRSADPELAATPIIALTAQAMHGDADRCLAAGASTYISKPFRVAEVLRVIQSYLRQGRLAGPRSG